MNELNEVLKYILVRYLKLFRLRTISLSNGSDPYSFYTIVYTVCRNAMTTTKSHLRIQ